jgi:hypothetical protein
MRRTRWTRKHRVTYYGKGGWHFDDHGVSYTNPVTGNAVGVVGGVGPVVGVFKCWRMRRKQERRLRSS